MDALIVFSSFELFAQFGKNTRDPQIQFENHIAALCLTGLFCIAGVGLGFFERERRLRMLDAFRLGVLSWLLALASSLTLLHFAFFMKVGRYALAYGSLGAIASVIVFHVLMGWLLRNYPHRFVLVGDLTPTSQELLEAARTSERGHLEHVSLLRDKIFGDTTLSLEETALVMEEDLVSDLVLTAQPGDIERVTSLATLALQKGLRVIDEGRFYGEIFRRYPLENLSTHWIVRAGFDIHRPITNALKRLFDITFALFWLLLLSPFLVLIAIAIKLESRGPVFYIQIRQGHYSRPFRMIKFRSMKVHDAGSAATAPGDARITTVGKLIRPLHLDELPQLFNILLGEMSFVGPRPEALSVVEETRKRFPVFEIRHMLRPGLTGWAQINQGKTQDGFDEVRRKLSYDLYYLKNYGLIFDFLIVLRTVFVLTKKTW